MTDEEILKCELRMRREAPMGIFIMVPLVKELRRARALLRGLAWGALVAAATCTVGIAFLR